MISKKQRKASRIYNDKLRRSDDAVMYRNDRAVWLQKIQRMRRDRLETKRSEANAPAVSIPVDSVMRRREDKKKTTLLNTMRGWFKRAVA